MHGVSHALQFLMEGPNLHRASFLLLNNQYPVIFVY
jgi:hypothetical protein